METLIPPRMSLVRSMSAWWLVALVGEFYFMDSRDLGSPVVFSFFSLVLFPASAYRLSRFPAPIWWFVAYGALGSLAFLVRGQWLAIASPGRNDISTTQASIAIAWLSLAGLLSCLCWFAAELQRARGDDPGSPAANRMGLRHLLLGTLMFGLALGIMRAAVVRADQLMGAGNMARWLMAFATALSQAAAFSSVVIFAARRIRRIAFPVHMGEHLLLALGAYFVLASTPLVLFIAARNPNELIATNYWMLPFGRAAVVLMSLVLLANWPKATYAWRAFIASIVVVNALEFFDYTLFTINTMPMYQLIRVAPAVISIGAVTLNWQQERRLPWTSWLGIVTMWLTAATRLAWAYWSR